jgi:hypothetical protein
MLNTYIKNKGISKTIVGNNYDKHVEELKWDAKYDGNEANILLKTNSNGKKHKYNITLDNADLANMLNVNSVNVPIHKRLEKDFVNPSFRRDPNVYQIELSDIATPKLIPRRPQYMLENSVENGVEKKQEQDIIEKLIRATSNNYISSPNLNEEYIVPITLDKKQTNNYKSKRHHRQHLKTHRAFKKPKSSKSKSSKSKKKN